MRKLGLLVAGLLSSLFGFGQTSINGIVNDYTEITAFDSCPLSISVANATALAVGDAVLIVQMQGASMVSTESQNYGNITNINNAGNFERAVIDSISGNDIWFEAGLLRDYDLSGSVQLVRIAQYTSAIVTDTLYAAPWNGTTGGILAIEVTDSLVLNANIDVSEQGFRAAAYANSNNNGCLFFTTYDLYIYPLSDWRSAPKGEGIVPIQTGAESGRGNQANGGGGANDHNAGGGGGSNYGAGGQGGWNNDPGSFNCHGYYPGDGGVALQYTDNRIFMGGAGGCGHGNNNFGTPGRNGGGIAVVNAGTIVSNGFTIRANGGTAEDAAGDGSGGGGAGGSLLVSASNYADTLALEANGGDGGSTDNILLPRCMGPGGGGGGGRISVSGVGAVVATATGGSAGVVYNSTDGCDGSNNFADDGNNGLIDTLSTVPQGTDVPELQLLAQPQSIEDCPAGATSMSFSMAGGGTIQWQINQGNGWQNLLDTGVFSNTTDTVLSIDSLAEYLDGYQLRAFISSNCFGTVYTDSASIIVHPAPYIQNPPSSTVVCDGNFAALALTAVGSIDSYQWQIQTDSGFVDLQNGGIYSNVNQNIMFVNPASMSLDSTEFRCIIAGCGLELISNEIFLDVIPGPAASFGFSSSVAMADFVNQSQLADSIEWNLGDGTVITDQDSVSHEYAANGFYDVTLTAWNACGESDTTITIEIVGIGIGELAPHSAVQVYPNPANNALNILIDDVNAAAPNLKASIFSATGQRIWTGPVLPMQQGLFKVNLSILPEGFYTLQIDGYERSITPFLIMR